MSMLDRDQHDDIDALIDDTARAMTAGTPPPSLRAAIRQRIDRPSRVFWRTPMWQTGMAAASIVIVAFIGGRAWLPVTVEPELGRTTVEEVIATGAPPVEAPVARPPAPTRAIARSVAREAPLEAPMPIEIEPLVLQSVDPMVLAVKTITAPMPLNVMPIVVEPLSMQ
jgi:hypothetical protein